MKKLFTLTTLLALLSFLLSACGGSSGGSSLDITMTEYKYAPAAWTVPAGKAVTLNLKNTGSVVHTWTLVSKPVTDMSATLDKANVLFDSGDVAAGASKTVTFTAPTTPGTYQVICTDKGHFELGMTGQLTVQ